MIRRLKVDGSGRGAGPEGMKMWLSRDEVDCDVGERSWAIE